MTLRVGGAAVHPAARCAAREFRPPCPVHTLWQHTAPTHSRLAGSSLGQVSKYTDPSFLDTYVSAAKAAAAAVGAAEAPRPLQLWMGETSGAGGATDGAQLVIGKVLGLFWFADKLGAAAAAGHAVVCKQQFQYQLRSQPGGGVAVTPEFWLTQLWRALMGRDVLTVTGGGGSVRCYAHKSRAVGGGGASGNQVVMVVINLAAEAAAVPITLQLGGGGGGGGGGAVLTASEHKQYQLTAWPNPQDLQSNATALNGRPLELGAAPAPLIPAFVPRTVAGSTVASAGFSVTFAVFDL